MMVMPVTMIAVIKTGQIPTPINNIPRIKPIVANNAAMAAWQAKKIQKNPKYIGIRMAQNPQNQRPALGKSHNQLLKDTIGFHIHFEVFSWTFPQFSRRGFCRLSPLNLGIAIAFYWKRKKLIIIVSLSMNECEKEYLHTVFHR